MQTCACDRRKGNDLKLPGLIVADRLDGPLELVSQRLGEELLNRNVGLRREHNSQARVDVVLA